MNLENSKRLIVAVAYLVTVNILCGFIAVEFRYPSLWGKSSVFPEYAYPVPMSWALMHWLSMAPLTYFIFRMWDWEPGLLRRFRGSLLAVALLCITADIVYGGGRFHRVPFLLFPFVDTSTALLLTFVMTRRGLVRTSAFALAGVVLLIGVPALTASVQQQIDPYGLRGMTTEKGWLRPIKVVREEETTVYVLQFEPAANNENQDDICYETLRVYEQMLQRHEPFDRTTPVVRLTRPDAPEKQIGHARYSNNGRWLCSYDE